MRHQKISDMTKGWFVGDFLPCSYRTAEVEVGLKSYQLGEREDAHYHKVATEITVVVSGQVQMAGSIWSSGDIITLDPGEETDFVALTNAVTIVVKLPSVTGDKYLSDRRNSDRIA